MNTQKQLVTVRDLVEEAKKRVVILAVCVVGLSYLMSLTSSSVWVNLPAAACLIILVRYFALDLEMKKKAAVYNSKPSSVNESSLKKHPEFPKSAPRSDWRSKVNSQVVEDAINHFTRHLVSEWVTDLWYSRITPDKEGPEELVQIINGVFGEFSSRFRNLNLIDLLTRDLIHIICRHLELFRSCQAKIEKQNQRTLTIEGREVELRRVMAAENKLHPALFSSESEHKVLQHLVAGLISFTFRHEDLQCAYFRFTVRELLACCVLRPVLNLANPRFINERIEVAVKSKMRVQKRIGDTQETPESDDLTSILPDHFSRHLDPSITGVELVQLKNEQDRTAGGPSEANLKSGADLSKDPLLSIDTRSSRSWNSYPINSKATNDRGNNEGGEWCDVLDLMSRRKTETLEPDNLESVWAKGRNYKRKEDEKKFTKQVPEGLSFNKVITANNPKEDSHRGDNNSKSTLDLRDSGKQKLKDPAASLSNHLAGHPCQADDEQVSVQSENAQVESSSSYTSEEEEPDNATGLSTLGTKVWDGRANRNLGVAHIHHPLESCASFKKKSSRGHTQYQKFQRNQSGRKRSRVSNQNLSVWQEVERTSVLPGDDKDILGYTQGHVIGDDATDDSDTEYTGRAFSGVSSSSSGSFFSLPDQGTFTGNSLKSSLMVDSFAKLRCQVLGANIVESGSKIFAVYSVSVADESNHSWSVKRRFRHFEELHRRLKEFQEYNLHLPPKHFLSTGLDIPVIQERCILLDSYLKKLLQLPRVSGSIEVWDFLSVDSQTYAFSSSFSIIDTLSVKVDHKPSGRSNNISNITGPVAGSLASRSEDLSNGNGLKTKDVISQVKIPGKEHIETSDPDLKTGKESGGSKKSYGVPDSVNDPTLPTEWVPPKLTVPLLDLVDVVLNLQEGGWIRRKAFWVAKQVLQLGMGDALDDWLLEKIRLLRRGSVVASGVQRVEQILWPDGIFITKHPKRQQQQQESHPPRATSLGSHTQQTDDISSPRLTDEEQHEERAKFVYELMINKAPATVVSLVGRMEYEHCAKDLYFFLQSSVCLKQLAFDLLELLLLSAFPEMDRLFKEIHEEKHKFGDFEAN